MENLSVALPPALQYDSAESRAILSTRRTIAVNPTTGTSVGSSGSGASSSDIVQFKLPNSGCLANCYLKYTIQTAIDTAGSDGTNTFATEALVADPYAPSAGVIRRMVVSSSDGTEIQNTNNYFHYCSVMARFKNSREYSENQGAVLEGCPSKSGSDMDRVGSNIDADGGDAVAADELGLTLTGNFEENAKRLNGLASSTNGWLGTSTGIVHKFQTGILDQKAEHMLPLALLGSGMNVFLHLNDAKDFLRATPNQGSVPANKAYNALDMHPVAPSGITYSLTDLQLVCDLVFYPPEVMSSISNSLCQGLRFRTDRVRNQVNAVSQESNVVILNEHARSVNAIIFGVKNSGDRSNVSRDENEYYKTPANGSSSVKEWSFQVGSETLPASQPCKFGSQSYCELEKALKSVFDPDFQMGNQVSNKEYLKARPSDSAGAGAGGAGVNVGGALMGVNLRSHPEIPSVMSGKSASSGSIPISCTLDFDGSTSLSNAECEFFTISDQIVEMLSDGSCLIHK